MIQHRNALLAALSAVALMAAPAALGQDAKKKPAAAKKATSKKAPGKKAAGKKAPGKKGADKKAGAKKAKKPGKVEVTWLGHAAFQVVSPEGAVLLIDPFLTQNPATPKDRKDLGKYKPDAILVSHSHSDHLGDTPALAKQSGAKVIGEFGFISSMKIKDELKLGGNVGGSFTIKDVTVHLVPAMHSSDPGGRPLGFVLEFKKKRAPKIYHSGDTWLFGDMKLIHDVHKPTVLLLNSGGGPYTQNPKTATLAVKKFFRSAKTVIPMHFGTFPPLAQEADVKKGMKGLGKKLKVLKPGESASF